MKLKFLFLDFFVGRLEDENRSLRAKIAMQESGGAPDKELAALRAEVKH